METIIIGLGNPGEQYKNTRHNVGFMALDKFAKKNNFPDFAENKKSEALVTESDNIVLAKPQTFMNNSGKTAKAIAKNKNKKNVVVVHDDVDLPVGKIKIVIERGSAGHKGVESVIKAIGNKNLIRVRIGTGKAASAKASAPQAGDIVLKNFSKTEQPLIDEAIKKTAEALDLFVKEGLDMAMNEYNR